jgi:hypothetical protein
VTSAACVMLAVAQTALILPRFEMRNDALLSAVVVSAAEYKRYTRVGI